MPTDNTHPSIITVGTPTFHTTVSYPIGVEAVDRLSKSTTIRDGELTLLQGSAAAGRTAKLLEVAAATVTSATWLNPADKVLIAVVEDDPKTILNRLQGLGVSDDVARSSIRIGKVRTSGELAYFVAQAVHAGASPRMLLIDDLGVIDADSDSGNRKPATVASRLAAGSVAWALELGTGLSFGAFSGLSHAVAHIRPIAVLGTVRAPRDGSMWNRADGSYTASTVVTLDGKVLKSRRFGHLGTHAG